MSRRRSAPRLWNRRLWLTPLEDRLAPAAFTVTNTADSGAGSLRAAVIAANGSAGLDTITFTGGTFASSATITLTSGELAVSDSLIVDGTIKGTLTVSGNNASRLFNINDAVTGSAITVALQNMTLTKGATSGANDGGAIFIQDEDVTLTNCLVSANTSASDGGAIRVEATGGKLTLDDCTIQTNSATGGGGGVSAVNGPTVIITNSTLSGNSATAGGFMNMFQGGTLTITGSTFSGNNAVSSDGGALFLNGVFASNAIRNSTFSSNFANSDGGAIAISSSFSTTLTVQNCTIASNVATTGNGGGIARTGGSGTVGLTSTIVFSNGAGTTADNLFTAGTVNATLCLITNTTGVTTFNGDVFTDANIGVNPNIGSLANNGGPTQTRALLAGSVAIDAGSNPAGLTTDQRGTGYFRVRGKAADIGAFETPDDFIVTNTNNSGAGSLRQAVLDANAAVGLDTIAFDTTVFASAKTITLTTGELLVTEFLTVEGPTGALTVSGNNASRIFRFENASAVASGTLRNLTLTAGKVGAGVDGGAIFTTEPLTLTTVTITNSNSADEGGAIRTSGTGISLNMDSCTLSGNAALSGGAVAVDAATSVSIKNSTFSGNSASGSGGAFVALGSASVSFTNSTLSGNTAATGGAIALLVSAGNNNILNSTITGNAATGGKGGGVYAGAGTINLDSTIASGNTGASGPDIFNPGTTNVNFSAVGVSLGFKVTGANNLPFGTDLLLGPLAGNGGATKTHSPAVNSPVLGKGNNATGLANDQRGVSYPRQRSIGIDIGAVEVDQIIVINTASSGPGSLNQAVLDANAFGFQDTITFDPTVFATSKTINTGAELVFTESAEIVGPAVGVTISGQLLHRVIQITAGTDFDFSNLSLLLGSATGDGGALLVDAPGNSTVNFSNCTLGFNSATGIGGAVAAANDKIVFVDCVVTNNRTTGVAQDGGAVVLTATGTVSLTRTAMSNNTATGDGGGVALVGGGSALLVFESTVSNNSSGGKGGGLFFEGGVAGSGVQIRNSTVSGNKSAADGGGFGWSTSSGTVQIQNSTITNNTATGGGGGGLSVATGTGNLNIESSIVSGNSNAGAPDIDNPNTTTVKTSAIGDNLGFVLTSAGGNLPFQPHANLKLGPLASNGGPTSTHMPLVGSPLINVGTNPAGLTTDQRGFFRVSGGTVDIGSIEFLNTVVKNTNNIGADSLRQIIFEANAAPGAQTITFDSTVFATKKTITLTSGELEILDALTIAGPAAGVIISANKTSRVFNIGENVPDFDTNLSNLTLRDGATGSGAKGGAVLVSGGKFTLTNCAIVGNSSGDGGGAIAAAVIADLVLVNCSISDNTAAASGGGIAFSGGLGSITISASLITNNSAGIQGGGLLLGSADLSIINSTIVGNIAATNGGGFNITNIGQPIILRNLTITGNSAATGGGFFMPNSLSQSIDSCIVFGNTAGSGPDISYPGTLNVGASLIGSKAGVTTFSGDAFTNSHIGADPLLGPLQDNGGPTLTMLPTFVSPAVNNGTNPSALTTDQRGAGFVRVFGGAIDIGAVETHTFMVTNTNNSGAGSLRQAVLDANASAGLEGIIFDPTVFATAKTITLTTGELAITDSVSILGPAANLTVSGNNLSRVFNINGAGTLDVAISDMTLVNGNIIGSGGAITLADESLSLSRVTISGSKASGNGGAILVTGGSLTIDSSTLSGNTANFAGAIQIDGTSSVILRNSTLSGNSVSNVAGALARSVAANAAVTILNCTVTANTAGVGGGGLSFSGSGAITITSSIVSGNSGGSVPDISGGVVLLTFSAVGSNVGFTVGAGSGNNLPFGTNLKLGALASNGGPTQTHLPALDSPLINVGTNAAGSTVDQRGSGFPRNFGGGVDIGAIESRALIVSNTNDAGVGSLRQNVIDANTLAGSDTITFDPTVFASAQSITLTTGDIDISESLTVTGPGVGVTISGNNASRIFDVASASVITFTASKLTLTQGSAIGSEGGAIRTRDDLIDLTDCILTGNTGTHGGAIGIDEGGGLYATRCTFTNNTSGFGGAIDIFGVVANGGTKLTDCTLSGNSASARGGAIYCINIFQMTGSTVSNNISAGDGGAIYLGGSFKVFLVPAVVINSTISGNTAAAFGGGVALANFSGYDLGIVNGTVTGNSAGIAGGAVALLSGTANVTALSSVVFGNTAPTGPEFSVATKVTANASLIGSKAGATTFTPDAFTLANLGVDPLLGPLQNNGGSTLTHLPAAKSPAVSNGSNSTFGLVNDQRGAGFPRLRGAAVDIGAVEVPVFVVTNTNNSGAGSLRQAIVDANATAGKDTILFDPTAFATAKTITLTSGTLLITDSVEIAGPTAGVTVSGNGLTGVFNINGAGVLDVSISDVTVKASNVQGIFISGESVSLTRVTITGCAFGGIGASLFSELTLISCSITNNSGNSGIDAGTNSKLTVIDSTIADNTSNSSGGGIDASLGTITLIGSTISGNSTKGSGGGVYLGGSLSANIRNSTISGNQSDTDGGGISWNSTGGTVTLQNSTVFANTSGTAGGNLFHGSGAGVFALESTIVHSGTAPTAADINNSSDASFVTVKSSLVGVTAGTLFTDLGGNIFGVNPLLAPLASNGGATKTHAILPGSPVINAGSNPASLTTDQRGAGFNRINGGGIDIGAFESNLAPTVRKITINGGAVQRSRVTSVTVDFDSVVTFTGSAVNAFQFKRQSDNAVPLLSAAVINGPTTSVTLTFLAGPAVDFGSLADGRYTLTVDQSKVTANGSKLDGNADGTGGDNFVLVGTPANGLFRLFGDADGSGQVTSSDFLAFRLAFLSASTAFDFDGNGSVDSGDFLQFRLRFLQSV